MDESQEDRDRLAAVIGNNARAARKVLELTQAKVAELLGLNAEFYGRIERGHALPSIQSLARMSVVLGVTVDHLLGDGTVDLGMSEEQDIPPAVAAIVDVVRDDKQAIRLVNAMLRALDAKDRKDD